MMLVTAQQILEKIKELPEHYARNVIVTKADPPAMGEVIDFEDSTTLTVTIDPVESGFQVACECGESKEEVCIHEAAFFKVLLDKKKEAAPVESGEEATPEDDKIPKELIEEGSPEEEPGAELANIVPQPATVELVLSPAELVERHVQLTNLIRDALEEDKDYGKIPGTQKDTLLKPGAERIATAFGCYPKYTIIEQEIDHNQPVDWEKSKWVSTDKKPDKALGTTLKAQGKGRWRKFDEKWVWQEPSTTSGQSIGLYRYVVQCNLIRRDTGQIVGSAPGSCSTMESKYIEHPRDLENTILKMACKRALVACVLNTYGLSDRFTQDVEEMAHL
jgi:hypothetical protein